MSAADALAQAGYGGLFLSGDDSTARAIWDGGAGRAELEAVLDDGSDLEKVLAAEVLYAFADDFPGDRRLGEVYARALALSGLREGPPVLMANLWGLLDAGGDGPLGEHLLAAGESAKAPLRALLDDDALLFYEGSEEATIGNARRHRVKDAAAYFLGELEGSPVRFSDDPAERDAQISRRG